MSATVHSQAVEGDPTEAEVKANEAGYECAMEGNASYRDNPHAPGTAEHRAWDAGFAQGLDARRAI